MSKKLKYKILDVVVVSILILFFVLLISVFTYLFI